jgi:hypothetical protein
MIRVAPVIAARSLLLRALARTLAATPSSTSSASTIRAGAVGFNPKP